VSLGPRYFVWRSFEQKAASSNKGDPTYLTSLKLEKKTKQQQQQQQPTGLTRFFFSNVSGAVLKTTLKGVVSQGLKKRYI
jgi:hypothetical protein